MEQATAFAAMMHSMMITAMTPASLPSVPLAITLSGAVAGEDSLALEVAVLNGDKPRVEKNLQEFKPLPDKARVGRSRSPNK